MADKSKIEWTEATWNPVTGCTKISEGCQHCYAFNLAKRLKSMGNKRYINEFEVTLQQDLITLPLQWKSPRRIFVNSMSDLFHEEIPIEFIERVFYTMGKASWHEFQILTKRTKRLVEVSELLQWPTNVWQGVSIENERYLYRLDDLRKINAKTKFVSMEPLIGEIKNINLTGIDWVIVGGESGAGARPMSEEWPKMIRDICLKNNVPFFFKQWGGPNKKKSGRLLDGVTWDEYPNNMKKD